MYGTYCRLGVTIYATGREVIRAASHKIKEASRYSRHQRNARHKFYREMLRYHAESFAMARQMRIG